MAAFGGLGESETLAETMDIYKLETEIAKFIYELETEDRLVRVGLKDVAESAKVYKKYKHLFSKKLLDELLLKTKQTKDTEQKEITQRIYFMLAGSFVGRKTSAAQDKITTYFSKAKVKVGGETITYYQIAPKISKEPIFEKREKYDLAAMRAASRVNPKYLSLLTLEIKLIKSLGFGGYVDFFGKAKKQDYGKFYSLVGKIVRETDSIWQKSISKVSQDVFGRPFGNISDCHLNYLRSMSAFDNFYPQDKVVASFKKFVHDMGLGSLLLNIKIDDEDRSKKNPRAVCYWPKPPDEVHLVIKPIGGEQDFEAMFHEGGHALHGAAIDRRLPFAFANLARSNALTEAYAFVLEAQVFDPDWLTVHLNVSSFTGARILWQAIFADLMMLRRYLGKFSYEYEMFSANNLTRGPTLYKKNLQETTGFVTLGERWLRDLDAGFYSAEYLRAWIGASQIKDYLIRKFGRRWFINKKAGLFLRKLFARGVTDELEDVVARLGYKPWDASFLIKEYRRVLD